MKVSEVMTRDVQTVRADQPVQEAASFMLSADAGSIPVTDGDRLIGMITDRDIAVRGIAQGYGPDTPVRELMTDDVVCARPVQTAKPRILVSKIDVRLMQFMNSGELRSLHPEIGKEKSSFRTRFVFDSRDNRRRTLPPAPLIHAARASLVQKPRRQETRESEAAGMQ